MRYRGFGWRAIILYYCLFSALSKLLEMQERERERNKEVAISLHNLKTT
jgi:hypothetical protein